MSVPDIKKLLLNNLRSNFKTYFPTWKTSSENVNIPFFELPYVYIVVEIFLTILKF